MLSILIPGGDHTTVERVPRYGWQPLLHESLLLIGGKCDVELVPLYPPDEGNPLATCPVPALMSRTCEKRTPIRLFSVRNEALMGSIQDVLSSRCATEGDIPSAPIQVELVAHTPVLGRLAARPLVERELASFQLGLVGIPSAQMPKVFRHDVWRELSECALRDVSRETLACLETAWYWDPSLQCPWLCVEALIPFDPSELTTNEHFVQAHAGKGLARTVGRRVSLFHTHVVSQAQHALAFFSDSDRETMRRHLHGQISLVANVVKGQPEAGCRFHLYAWEGGNLVQEGFYVEIPS